MNDREDRAGPIDPAQTYVALSAEGEAVPVPGGAAFWARPEAELDEIGRRWLVTEFACAADWPHWEMHPQADEFVYLLEGEAVLELQDGDGAVRRVALQGRGAVVVPRGVWHTAKVAAPSRMLFITLGTGTRHRPLDADGG